MRSARTPRGTRVGGWLLACAIALATPWLGATTLTGTVVGVADGDTVTVLDERQQPHTVRLAGIDAPEKGMPWGQRSRQHLAARVFGRAVEVEGHKRDRYGRLVAVIRLAGDDVNLEQVREGMAWHYRDYEREQSPNDRSRYRDAEAAAREARLGLWADAAPVAPWQWRRKSRQGARRESPREH